MSLRVPGTRDPFRRSSSSGGVRLRSPIDYIVVGAGSAGCIVAARLSEDPSVRVLLVEAGGSDRNPIITMPGALPFVYQSKRIQWGYRSGPEPELGGRMIDEKAGRVLGGSSSINAMIFNRGNPMDYQGWAADGLTDWDYAHCLPYFRKMETFVDGPDDWRGADGPLRIGRCQARHKLFDAWLRAGEQAGYEVTPDHNGYRQEGMHIAQSFIHGGRRWSSSHAYLRPALDRANLQVLTGRLVTRVLIEDGRAIGIEVSQRRGTVDRITCEREVVLSAGALNSPKLLQLSGIGDPDQLRAVGVAVTAQARQVGENLQNHPGVDIQFAADHDDSLTSELSLLGRGRIGAEWLFTRSGLGAGNFFEAGAFLRGRADLPFPNLQYEFLPLTRVLRNGKLVPIPGFQVWLDLSRPRSRGYVRLRSPDPRQVPSIVFNTYSEHQDLFDLADGVRLAREQLVRQPALSRYLRGEISVGADDPETFIRQHTGTSYHPCGTCRMGTDTDAVVDSEGRVTTVTGLRVVDASIMPKVITGNLNAPVMMMAEKIADRIRGITPLAPSPARFHVATA